MRFATQSILAASLVLAVLVWPQGASARLANSVLVVDQIVTAILREDSRYFVRHMQGSTYFVDELYTKPELVRLFRDKSSWLQRNLFIGERSVKHYLKTAQNLVIVHRAYGQEEVFSFQSSNFPPHEWPWCAVRAKGRSFVFCDLFGQR